MNYRYKILILFSLLSILSSIIAITFNLHHIVQKESICQINNISSPKKYCSANFGNVVILINVTGLNCQYKYCQCSDIANVYKCIDNWFKLENTNTSCWIALSKFYLHENPINIYSIIFPIIITLIITIFFSIYQYTISFRIRIDNAPDRI